MDTLLYRHIRLDTGETFYIGIGNKNDRMLNEEEITIGQI